MKKNEISTSGKNYPVYIGANIFDSLEKIINSNKVNKNLFLVIDKKFQNLHRQDITRFTSNYSGRIFAFEYEACEQNKSFDSLLKILSDLITKNFGRDTTVIAIGGGITGDLAGFAASVYSRGVQFIQIPTTLLSAVDSSVGGKTGINFEETKNIIGSFYQPDLVLVDTEFLKTLPDEEIVCGMGEVIKYAFLTDLKFFITLKNSLNKLLRLDSSITSKVIEACINFKGDVVSKDERESGLRKILNLGHTFAHGIEVEQNYKIKHGQAVIIGLVCALELSRKIGMLDKSLYSEYLSLPLAFKDKIMINSHDTMHIYDIMKRDKKGRDQKIKFVLLKEIGNLIVDVEAEESDILQSLQQGINYFIK
jgi:3-dehydroquinate synthase